MRLHDEFTPRGIFAPRCKFASRGKLKHINGTKDALNVVETVEVLFFFPNP